MQRKTKQDISDGRKDLYDGKKTRIKGIILLSILAVVICLPWVNTGIIVNDELQARALSLRGFSEFYRANFKQYLHDGRPLAAIVNSFTMYMGFIGKGDTRIFKTIQIIILVGESFLFAIFVKRITDDKKIGSLAGILSFILLPITFEHMAPGAFVGLLGIPFAALLGSLSLYVDCLKEDNVKKMVVSMLLYFFALMSYETFITYVLLYLLIAFAHFKVSGIKRRKFFYIFPLLFAGVYLFLYIAGSKLFASGYSGNQIGFESLRSSIKIIGWLFLACIPGFFLVIPRYRYLESIYGEMTWEDWVWLLLVASLAVILIFSLCKNIRDAKTNPNSFAIRGRYIVAGALLYMLLPSLPISVSKMYQGNVGPKGFLTLPITHYEYFAAVLLLSCILVLLLNKFGKRIYIVTIVALGVLLSRIQTMNLIFSREQASNYNRIVMIERFLSTNCFLQYNGYSFSAPDLYKQQNTLAIHEEFWTNYVYDNFGLRIQIEKEASKSDSYIFLEDNSFIIVTPEEIRVVASKELSGAEAIKLSENDYVLFEVEEYEYDNGFYVYSSSAANYSLPYKVGYKKVEGAYTDRWLAKESVYSVNAGEEGLINIGLYYPEQITDDMAVFVYIDDQLVAEQPFKNNTVEFSVECEKNINHTMRISTNFEMQDKGGDLRELAVMLTDLEVR